VVLYDGFEAREDVAVLPGCAGRRVGEGGEADELEEVEQLSDFSPELRAADGGFGLKIVSSI
jgi:hypothetical protein